MQWYIYSVNSTLLFPPCHNIWCKKQKQKNALLQDFGCYGECSYCMCGSLELGGAEQEEKSGFLKYIYIFKLSLYFLWPEH